MADENFQSGLMNVNIIDLGNEMVKQNGTNMLYLASWILVNIGSVNGLLPDGTEPSHYLNYSSIITILQPLAPFTNMV